MDHAVRITAAAVRAVEAYHAQGLSLHEVTHIYINKTYSFYEPATISKFHEFTYNNRAVSGREDSLRGFDLIELYEIITWYLAVIPPKICVVGHEKRFKHMQVEAPYTTLRAAQTYLREKILDMNTDPNTCTRLTAEITTLSHERDELKRQLDAVKATLDAIGATLGK